MAYHASDERSRQLPRFSLSGLPWGFRGRTATGQSGKGETVPKLTKKVVDGAQLATRDYFIWDEALPGFGLRVFPAGRKSYLIQYKVGGRGGQTRRMAIGLHGVLTPEEARSRARRSWRP